MQEREQQTGIYRKYDTVTLTYNFNMLITKMKIFLVTLHHKFKFSPLYLEPEEENFFTCTDRSERLASN